MTDSRSDISENFEELSQTGNHY